MNEVELNLARLFFASLPASLRTFVACVFSHSEKSGSEPRGRGHGDS